jgi:hypothetical protein
MRGDECQKALLWRGTRDEEGKMKRGRGTGGKIDETHLRQSESGNARRRDAERKTGEEAGIVTHAANAENELDLLLREGRIGGEVEGEGFAGLAEL